MSSTTILSHIRKGSSTMSKVAIWARIPLRPGVREEAAKALQVAIDNANGEEGTLPDLHENAPTDALFLWPIRRATAHSSGEGRKVLGGILTEFGAGRPEMQMLTPIIGKGL
jgi:hypothetical protein